MNKELIYFIPDSYKIKNILNKYKNIATTKSFYHKSLESLVKELEGIPSFRMKFYEIYINSSYNDELVKDIKEICKEYRIKSIETNLLPENVIAVKVNKMNWIGGR